jgi:hypothetical protein
MRTTLDNNCRNNADLFLSTDINDHTKAATICADCPAIQWCHDQARNTQRDHPGGLHGTWAGTLYVDGRISTGRASVGECPSCGVPDGKACVSPRGKTIGAPHLARYTSPPACRICATEFQVTKRQRLYCSEECAEEGARRRYARYDAKRPSRAA